MRRPVILALMVVAAGCTSPGGASTSEPTTSPSAVSEAPASPPPAAPPSVRSGTAEQVEGRFRLTFSLPRTTWSSDEGIEGVAALALIDGDLAELSGASSLLAFTFAEVDGRRQMGPAWDTICARYRLPAGSPIISPITKSGGYGEGDPDVNFYRSFFADPLVRLPAGDWDISAVAEFIDDPDCRGEDDHSMRATVRVHVTD